MLSVGFFNWFRQKISVDFARRKQKWNFEKGPLSPGWTESLLSEILYVLTQWLRNRWPFSTTHLYLLKLRYFVNLHSGTDDVSVKDHEDGACSVYLCNCFCSFQGSSTEITVQLVIPKPCLFESYTLYIIFSKWGSPCTAHEVERIAQYLLPRFELPVQFPLCFGVLQLIFPE